MNRPARRQRRSTIEEIRVRLGVLVGSIAEVVLPGLAREIDEGQSSGRALGLKRAIVHSRLWHAERKKDQAAIERALLSRWRSDIDDEFHVRYVARFDRWFRGPHYRVVEALAGVVSANSALNRLVEVGCGDGRALVHLAERLPGLSELVGVDINARIIARNVRAHGDRPRLRFVHADARRVLEEETREGTILFSYGGVLEYIGQAELARILARLARHRDTAVALVEPIDPFHDLINDAGSHIHGRERSFSHNHLALVASAGFTIGFAEERILDGIRWMMIVATASQPTARSGSPGEG
jgi:SAM-dependent methyltransferase